MGLVDILRDKKFNLFFSFLLGLFIASLFRPNCKQGTCNGIFKIPPMNDLRTNSYKIGDKCYKFHPVERECPAQGVIEPFEWTAGYS